MALTNEGVDKLREKPVLREEREWIHPVDQGRGCSREGGSVYAPRGEPPKPCDGPIPTPYGAYPCGNEDWSAGDYVTRDKNDHIVRRSKNG